MWEFKSTFVSIEFENRNTGSWSAGRCFELSLTSWTFRPCLVRTRIWAQPPPPPPPPGRGKSPGPESPGGPAPTSAEMEDPWCCLENEFCRWDPAKVAGFLYPKPGSPISLSFFFLGRWRLWENVACSVGHSGGATKVMGHRSGILARFLCAKKNLC